MSLTLVLSQCLQHTDVEVNILSLFLGYYLLKTQVTVHQSFDELKKTAASSPKQRNWARRWSNSCCVDKWAHSWWFEGLRVVCAFSFLPPEIQVEELLSFCPCGSSPHSRKTVPNPGKLVIIIWLSACHHVHPPFGPWARSRGTW